MGFCYLSFLPGAIIYRILNPGHGNLTERILYSLGLSLVFLMSIGLVLTFIGEYINYSNPLSFTPTLLAVVFLTNFLLLILIVTDWVGSPNKRANRSYDSVYRREINLKDISLRQNLFFCLIPLISIIGAYILNMLQNNLIIVYTELLYA